MASRTRAAVSSRDRTGTSVDHIADNRRTDSGIARHVSARHGLASRRTFACVHLTQLFYGRRNFLSLARRISEGPGSEALFGTSIGAAHQQGCCTDPIESETSGSAVMSAPSPATENVASRVAALMPALLDDLATLVAIPSVAFPGFPEEPVHRMGEAAVELMQRSGATNARLLPIPGGYPAVWAEIPAPAGAPTVTLYAHYDVQPAPKEQGWDTEPFVATRGPDGRIYGRGAADDKSGLVIHAGTLQVLGADPPVGIKILIEGEEETDSHLEAFVDANPEMFDCDAFVIADMGNQAVGRPALTTALRGGVSCTVTGPYPRLPGALRGGRRRGTGRTDRLDQDLGQPARRRRQHHRARARLGRLGRRRRRRGCLPGELRPPRRGRPGRQRDPGVPALGQAVGHRDRHRRRRTSRKRRTSSSPRRRRRSRCGLRRAPTPIVSWICW